VVNGIATYKQALEDPRRVPEFREPDMAHSLLFKPVGQIVLFKALVRALQRSDTSGGRLTLEEAVRRADEVDWAISSDMWREILVRQTGAVTANRQSYDLGANLAAYLIAPEYTPDDLRERLRKSYNFAKLGIDLDDPGVVNDPDIEPLELPTPVTVRA